MMHGMSYSKMSAEDKKYHTESDVRTLVEAGEIKKDKARYKRAMAKVKEQQEALKYVGMDMGEMSYAQYSKARKSMAA
ncbi:hypothetical protein LCGC14_2565790 [marine sediment metagenome]|uniref:Uncharacterized protein n=1 Tax=marine sediment metagenome TaxID=412755 RepID=A0A0F9DBL3_9ZZZZ